MCIAQIYSAGKHFAFKFFGVILFLPFLVAPLLSIPASLVFAFIVGDMETLYETSSEDGLLCRVTSYGNATTSINGYNATLFKKSLPFEKKIMSLSMENTYKPEVTPNYVCSAAFAKAKS
jgi:hypothetical protein